MWQGILNIGVDDKLSATEIRKVRVLNGVILTGEIIFILLIVKSLVLDLFLEALVLLIGAVIVTVPIFLNKFKIFGLARVLGLLIPYLYLTGLAVYWGSERGSHLMLFACAGLAVLLFESKINVILLIALGGFFLIGVEVYNFNHEPFYISPNLRLSYITNILITLILLTATSVIIKQANEKYQKSIQSKNDQIISQHNQLLKLNRDINESMRILNEQTAYAKTIQQSILPIPEDINRSLPHHFIFFKPKDAVSGDFYFFSKQDNKVFLAAVDCTGHGVPGAFMSIIGHNLLVEAIEIYHIYRPSEVLDYIQNRIRHYLKQHYNNNNDGMDIALCMIDKEKGILEYAGAKHPLLLIQNDELKKIEADRLSIGGIGGLTQRRFTNHMFDIADITHFYIYTDGFRDQIGGAELKRFMSKNFREVIFANYDRPMEEQRRALEQEMLNWKGKQDQTDDILVIGSRLDFEQKSISQTHEKVNVERNS